ncbi:MAG TPA: hypothetical protein VLL57_03385 [Candidatus Binataceae bacterium]|nr:hypothetical protein [Candidatus Binataceae bacterium]
MFASVSRVSIGLPEVSLCSSPIVAQQRSEIEESTLLRDEQAIAFTLTSVLLRRAPVEKWNLRAWSNETPTL